MTNHADLPDLENRWAVRPVGTVADRETAIQMDVVLELDDPTLRLVAVGRLVAPYSLTSFHEVDPSGPGGGWPVWEFEGSVIDLVALLVGEFEYAPEEARDLVLATL